MAIPSYPSNLDEPVSDSFSLGDKGQAIGIMTEKGCYRTIIIGAELDYQVSISFSFEDNLKANAFRKFIKYDLNYCDLWFNANWFSSIGFNAGDWCFKFISMDFIARGHCQDFSMEALMSYKHDIVVNGNYTIKGRSNDLKDVQFTTNSNNWGDLGSIYKIPISS